MPDGDHGRSLADGDEQGAEVDDRPAVLPRLTSLRWFAALGVLVCHVAVQPHGAKWLIPAGAIGVGFFFVLSGFVLTWSSRPRDTAATFYRRRFARIYPATAVSTLLAVLLWSLSVPFVLGGRGVAFQLLLVQSWFPPDIRGAGNGVTWSLSCEAFFYLMFPLLLRAVRRWPRQTIAVVVAACLGWAYLTLALWSPETYYFPLSRLPEFVLGIALAVLMQQGWRPTISQPLAVGVFSVGAAAAAVTNLQLPGLINVYTALPGVAVLIVCAAQADVDGRTGWLTSRRLVYLGELSFCFYLVHAMVLRVVLTDPRTLGGAHSTAALVALGLLTLALSLAAAAALHHVVELPMQRLLLRRRPVVNDESPARRPRVGTAEPGSADVTVFQAVAIPGAPADIPASGGGAPITSASG